MSTITLQQQIDFMQSMNDVHMNLTSKSIMASLKRLQTIETQKPFLLVDPYSDMNVGYSKELHASNADYVPVYKLPLDAQGMIDALTAERDVLKAQLDETYTDERGTVWMRPTAFAYAAVCKANEEKHQLLAQGEVIAFCGEVVSVGDDENGQPRIIIHGTRNGIQSAVGWLLAGELDFYTVPQAKPVSDHIEQSLAMVDEREAFEQKAREHFDPMRANELLYRGESGNYDEWGVLLAWEAWQARAAINQPGNQAQSAPALRDAMFFIGKDGDEFYAVRDDFKNLHESEATFGKTPIEALCGLLNVPRPAIPEGYAAIYKDAARYQWICDISVQPHNFYLSVPVEFEGVRYAPHEVDAAIDEAMLAAAKGGE